MNLVLSTRGADEIFTRSDSSGTWSPFVDGLGSSLSLTDVTGSVRTEYTYGAFGQATTTGASNANSSQYTGRENDDVGLQYNRARYYSPILQRFISEDPLGFGGGDINLYAYVANSPTNFTDPSGLEISEIRSHISGPTLGARKDPDCSSCGARSGPKFPDNFDWWGAFWQEYWKRRNQSCRDNGGITMSGGTCMPLPMIGCGLVVVPAGGGPSFIGGESGPSISVPKPPANPGDPPGPGWGWKGSGPTPGGPKGNWHNPGTGESLHPDLGHPQPIGPHWDWKDPNGNWWRIFSDGRLDPKR